MKTLEVHLPDEIAASLARHTTDAEGFVLESLQLRLKKIEGEEKLAEEYKAAAVENESLMADFKYVDSEGWDNEY
ncbi:MAG: hypothetical protein LH609_20710 [Rudanella sp.]|nr:hypothetical protein [Rudanella sp.]